MHEVLGLRFSFVSIQLKTKCSPEYIFMLRGRRKENLEVAFFHTFIQNQGGEKNDV